MIHITIFKLGPPTLVLYYHHMERKLAEWLQNLLSLFNKHHTLLHICTPKHTHTHFNFSARPLRNHPLIEQCDAMNDDRPIFIFTLSTQYNHKSYEICPSDVIDSAGQLCLCAFRERYLCIYNI